MYVSANVCVRVVVVVKREGSKPNDGDETREGEGARESKGEGGERKLSMEAREGRVRKERTGRVAGHRRGLSDIHPTQAQRSRTYTATATTATATTTTTTVGIAGQKASTGG